MSTAEGLPPIVRQVIEEVLEALDGAESDALDNLSRLTEEDSAQATPYAPYVAGYLGATVKCQAARLQRVLDGYPAPAAPPKGKAP